MKPLGRKNYGSIPHLPESRPGPGDYHCEPGQAIIATVKVRDSKDEVIVQEKLDGSNVGVAKIDGEVIPLNRAGYIASSSPFQTHHRFHDWVTRNRKRFLRVLKEGERVCGEWLEQAHGTRYDLPHEPFVAFDIMDGSKRLSYDEFVSRVLHGSFISPHLLHRGNSLPISNALDLLGDFGFHGAIDEVEGAIWRVERSEVGSSVKVDFLTKFVKPTKIDGKFLPDVSGKEVILNSFVE